MCVTEALPSVITIGSLTLLDTIVLVLDCLGHKLFLTIHYYLEPSSLLQVFVGCYFDALALFPGKVKLSVMSLREAVKSSRCRNRARV